MGQGFQILRADGSVQINSDSIAFLFAKETYLGGNGTIAVPGAAGRNCTLSANGVNGPAAKFSFTQSDSGADRLLTVTASTNGYYRVGVDGGARSTFGIQWTNNAGTLAISSDDFGYAFCGNASYVGGGQTDAWCNGIDGSNGPGVGYNPTGSGANYFRRYQIDTGSSANAPVCFIQAVNSTTYYVLCSVSLNSGTTWDIWVGSNSWATAPAIKCFSRLVGAGSGGYGIKLVDASGQRTWDSTASMLVIAQILDFSGAFSNTIAALKDSKPHSVPNPYVFLGGGARVGGQNTPRDFGSPVSITEYAAGASLDGSNVYRTSRAFINDSYDDTGTIAATSTNNLQINRAYLINGNYY